MTFKGKIEEMGASLVFVGNGAPFFAKGFQEEFAPGALVLSDPDLNAYKLLEMRRGLSTIIGFGILKSGRRAAKAGFKQTATQGTSDQQGGVMLVSTNGDVLYLYRSAEAGDHPDPQEAISALAAWGGRLKPSTNRT